METIPVIQQRVADLYFMHFYLIRTSLAWGLNIYWPRNFQKAVVQIQLSPLWPF